MCSAWCASISSLEFGWRLRKRSTTASSESHSSDSVLYRTNICRESGFTASGSMSTITSARTSSGRSSANMKALRPPAEWPTSVIDRRPSWSTSACTSDT